MRNLFLQRHHGGRSVTSRLLQFGLGGLFIVSVIDSMPFPTLSGPDILTAILSANHPDQWYEYAAIATAGSVIGAYITYRLARKAGQAYIDKKFRGGKVKTVLKLYKRWGAAGLFASCVIPVPFPTGVLFAASGVSNYSLPRFLGITLLGRGIRYAGVALIAEHYGRQIIQVLRHPGKYWIWLLILALIVAAGTVGLIFLNRRMSANQDEPKSQAAA